MLYDILLSLTTWKGRIYDPSLKCVLLSMLKQETQFKYKVVLVLSTDEFPDKKIPEWLNELDDVCDYFEILWTKENTRAYKKYFPTRRKYPEENIVALDDDSTICNTFVEQWVKMLQANPDRMIIGTNHFANNRSNTICCVRYGAACFRKDSLYDLDEFVGRKYFGEHDDEYFALLSRLAGTKSVRVDVHKYIWVDRFQQNMKLEKVTRMHYNNLGVLWNNFFRDYPDLKPIYNTNIKIRN